ncbi:tyrosine-protein kinase STYK1 [Engraulis encrasicolus]|uniref:tyrosine-protein kinase STYK1 n=1 Tax=Engraulis encrasicolus TaxID=184585 RepID=UPI002FD64A24
MSNSTDPHNLCDTDDRLCVATTYQLEVIVVPAILVIISVLTILVLIILRCCQKKPPAPSSLNSVKVHTPAPAPVHTHGHDGHRDTHTHHQHHRDNHTHRNHHENDAHTHRDGHHHHQHHSSPHRTTNGHPHHHDNRHTTTNGRHHNQRRSSHRRDRQHLQGIDAPPELNPLEHEVLPLRLSNPAAAAAAAATAAVPQSPTEWQHGAFQVVRPLPLSFAVKADNVVMLHRARVERRSVILRVLKDTADASQRQAFKGFANFLSELGPHPFLPSLMGVVFRTTPLITAIEELENRDLLSFLWRCREDQTTEGPPCDITERQIFTMSGQVASALEYLHSKSCIHGNIGARSVLVGRDLTAKLWGLGPAYRRTCMPSSPGPLEDMELKKWQAPEVLARRPATQSSDIWSFGILLYEMVTLGDPPYPRVLGSELLQQLQRGKSLKRPAHSSNTLHSIIKACCQWSQQERPSLAEVRRKLQSGERSANATTVLRVPEPLDIEKYMREAGYGESYNYAVL